MTANAPVQPEEKAPSVDEAAAMVETRAQKSAEERVNRESEIETPEEIERKKRRSLSSFFETAAAYLMIHNVPGQGKVGKGPRRVVDYGTHVYIPSNPTPEHLQQAAQLARAKGWNSVTMFRPNGHGINEKVTAAMQQVDRNLHVCTDKRQAGSLYKSRLETILSYNAVKAAMREQAAMPQPMVQPAAIPQPA